MVIEPLKIEHGINNQMAVFSIFSVQFFRTAAGSLCGHVVIASCKVKELYHSIPLKSPDNCHYGCIVLHSDSIVHTHFSARKDATATGCAKCLPLAHV